jgi:hypothetical protein
VVGAIEIVRQSVAIHPGWLTLVTLALSLLVGFEAGTLRRWALARRGWTTLGTVSGRTAEECERRFFDLWLATQAVRAPVATAGDESRAGGGRSLLGALSGAQG